MGFLRLPNLKAFRKPRFTFVSIAPKSDWADPFHADNPVHHKLQSDADTPLSYLSPTPLLMSDVMADEDWTLARLIDACYAVRAIGIGLDTRYGEIRVLPSSWALAERKAIEAYEA